MKGKEKRWSIEKEKKGQVWICIKEFKEYQESKTVWIV